MGQNGGLVGVWGNDDGETGEESDQNGGLWLNRDRIVKPATRRVLETWLRTCYHPFQRDTLYQTAARRMVREVINGALCFSLAAHRHEGHIGNRVHPS